METAIIAYFPLELVLKIYSEMDNWEMSLGKYYYILNSMISEKLMLKKESDKVTTRKFQIGEHFFF